MRRARLLLGIALGAAIVASAVACNFVVDAGLPSYGATCMFPGRGQGSCGACLADKCQARIDACCVSNDCQILTGNGSDDGTQTILGGCIASPTGLNKDCRTLLDPTSFHQYQDAGYVDGSSYLELNHDVQVCAATECASACATSCDFQEKTSPCGACAVASCGAPLDACCFDLVDTGGDLVECIHGYASFCDRLRAPLDGGTVGAGSCRVDFADCIVKHCDTACRADAG